MPPDFDTVDDTDDAVDDTDASAYYRVRPVRDGNFAAVASLATEGPWGAGLQHGGPPNALAVACAEQALTSTGRTDLVALRIASDFVGPVPVAELDIRSSVLRFARSAALVEVVIAAGGRDCLSSRVWFVRDSDTAGAVSTSGTPPPAEVPVPDDLPGIDADFAYGRSIEWRFVDGSMRRPGPAAVWARTRLDLVAGWPWSGLARAALVADSGNGVSAELDWSEWGFLNVDLDVHLARAFVGEWVLLDAHTQLSAHGSGLATSVLSDVRGVVGSGNQTLVVGPRPR